MRRETIAIHAGFDADPTTKAVAVPIYQTAAYAFDSAAHGAALFDLEVEGYRYSRIGNPTNAVLEKRLAELEGGVAALTVASGQAALHYASSQRGRLRRQHRLRAPALWHHPYPALRHPAAPGHPWPLRRKRQRRGHRAADRRSDPGGVLREPGQSGRQHLRHRGRGENRARRRRAADRRQHRRHADPAAADRIRRGRGGPFADQIPRRAWYDPGRGDRRRRIVRLGQTPRAVPDLQSARRVSISMA